MKIKTIETNGITYIEPVPEATSEWYYGMDHPRDRRHDAVHLWENADR